ncbi:hypothetical protein TWF217_001702 [Orbilia oligospora]|nr:hypothetical protein TWF217_001702 [Orbilia oligospora]
MLSRFPGEKDKGNLVIIIIGDRNTTHENVILQMLYQKSRYRLRNDCPVYGYRLANTDEIRQRYLQSSCTKYVDWVKGKDDKEEWMDAWGLTGITEAVLKDTTKTIVELLKGEGEVVKTGTLAITLHASFHSHIQSTPSITKLKLTGGRSQRIKRAEKTRKSASVGSIPHIVEWLGRACKLLRLSWRLLIAEGPTFPCLVLQRCIAWMEL